MFDPRCYLYTLLVVCNVSRIHHETITRKSDKTNDQDTGRVVFVLFLCLFVFVYTLPFLKWQIMSNGPTYRCISIYILYSSCHHFTFFLLLFGFKLKIKEEWMWVDDTGLTRLLKLSISNQSKIVAYTRSIETKLNFD